MKIAEINGNHPEGNILVGSLFLILNYGRGVKLWEGIEHFTFKI